MSNPGDSPASGTTDLDGAKVQLAGNDRLRVEFKINDLVRRLLPASEEGSFCGGCRGCMGCGMIVDDISPQSQ